MANGTPVRLPSTLSPPSVPAFAKVTAGKPAPAEIGAATASAATALCYAMQELQQNGGLTSATRTAGGERVAQVAQLRLDSLGEIDDFNAVARAEGRRVLRAYLDADFYCTHGPGAGRGGTGLDPLRAARNREPPSAPRAVL